jgi:hypothetical protein
MCTNSMVNSYHLFMKICIVLGLLWHYVQNELSSLIIPRGSLVFIFPKTFFAILLFNILTLRVVDDCYFRNAPRAFNYIFQTVMVINSISTKRTITSDLNWTHWTQKRQRYMTLEIQFLAWDPHKNVAVLIRLMESQSLPLHKWFLCFNAFCW